MKEIEVGNYVRTNKGKIDKVTEIIHGKFHITYKGKEILKGINENIGNETEIIKHSKNIIDLIELGDYVNGERVLCFRNSDCDYDFGTEYNDDFGVYFGYDKEDLKSIVTKEQFKDLEYKIEGV